MFWWGVQNFLIDWNCSNRCEHRAIFPWKCDVRAICVNDLLRVVPLARHSTMESVGTSRQRPSLICGVFQRDVPKCCTVCFIFFRATSVNANYVFDFFDRCRARASFWVFWYLYFGGADWTRPSKETSEAPFPPGRRPLTRSSACSRGRPGN